ncbi:MULTISPECIES: SCO family protein [Paenibacillus]|uniref:SCO family protein n=1 Tax=Paenibacillus TaxID=44249 RepID=UPI00279574C1|nr:MULTISPECIES: SCO family protein [Paenibacillus]
MKKAVVLSVLLGLMMMFGSACSGGKPNQLQYEVAPFAFMNQDGNPVSLSDLKGKVWIADMVFTYCATVCPSMTANMAQLQQRLGRPVRPRRSQVRRDDRYALRQNH